MAKEKRNATIAWLERSNPLRGLTIAQANMIFDCARNGDTQRLHWMYQEIETQNPVLSMATTRRAGAAANFAWRVSERAAMDGSLSAEQKDAAERFFADIENLSDLFEHLDLALFRGLAHAQPIWEDYPLSGSGAVVPRVTHIELLDSWKFLKKDGEWLFNPACDGFSSNCVSCRDARLVTVERRRPVDVPALAIHLRAAVGSRDWGRFIERYALPKPAVVMAQNATEKDRDSYLESASALENGQVTVWPSGASLMDFAGSSRGVDPFTAFIQHQEKTILMLATGGTLGSMAESGAGTLAGNAQADVWDQIVSRDAGIIASAVVRSLLRPFLAAAFPGQPVAVDFDFDLTKKPTPKEIFETAAAAKSTGYLVDQATLEQETGYKLEKDTAPEGSFGGQTPAGFALNAQTPLQNAANRLQNAPSKPDEQGHPPAEDALVEAFSGLFEKTLAEAAAGEIKNTIDANGQEHDELGRFGEEGGGAADGKQAATSHSRAEMLSGKLRKITPSEAHVLLSEPVTVKNPTGVEFRFTKEKLLGDDSHLKKDHTGGDFHRRVKVMLYAIDAAKTSRDITNKSSSKPNSLGVYEPRKEIRKTFTDPDNRNKKFEVVVRADKNGEVFDAFDVFPR